MRANPRSKRSKPRYSGIARPPGYERYDLAIELNSYHSVCVYHAPRLGIRREIHRRSWLDQRGTQFYETKWYENGMLVEALSNQNPFPVPEEVRRYRCRIPDGASHIELNEVASVSYRVNCRVIVHDTMHAVEWHPAVCTFRGKTLQRDCTQAFNEIAVQTEDRDAVVPRARYEIVTPRFAASATNDVEILAALVAYDPRRKVEEK